MNEEASHVLDYENIGSFTFQLVIESVRFDRYMIKWTDSLIKHARSPSILAHHELPHLAGSTNTSAWKELVG